MLTLKLLIGRIKCKAIQDATYQFQGIFMIADINFKLFKFLSLFSFIWTLKIAPQFVMKNQRWVSNKP